MNMFLSRLTKHYRPAALFLLALASTVSSQEASKPDDPAKQHAAKSQSESVAASLLSHDNAPGRPSSTELKASNFVGSEACKTCHEKEFKSHQSSPHWKMSLLRVSTSKPTAEAAGCETCHGPGKDHVQSGGEPHTLVSLKMTGLEASKQCLTCHQLDEEHSNFLRSEHLKNNVGCLDCHSMHQPKLQESLLKSSQPQLCYGCHLETKPEFAKPFHHRVNEGLVKCSDCHNPHGGFLQASQLRSSTAQDAVCLKCHAEKAGPFVFEHPPVKTEGCVACHMPHGSANARLLKRANVNLVCLECHTMTAGFSAPGTPSFHNLAGRYHNCLGCHTNIHGSNSSAAFFK